MMQTGNASTEDGEHDEMDRPEQNRQWVASGGARHGLLTNQAAFDVLRQRPVRLLIYKGYKVLYMV